MFSKRFLRLRQMAVIAALAPFFAFAAPEPDPAGSPMWDYLRPQFLGDEPYQFDERIQVIAPAFAENAFQVPLTVDARGITQPIEKIVVWADLNPIQHIFTYHPHEALEPLISLRFRVQQATPIHAAVKTDDGWHVGWALIDAQGGGCTAPTLAASNPYWENHLGEIESARFSRADNLRYRFQVIHPMDTGLVGSVPEFYLESLEIRDDQGAVTGRMELSPPVSENPVFTFEFKDQSKTYSLWMRDNGGNIFEAAL